MSVSTEPEEHEPELQGQMSFLDHLEELRRRILNMIIAIAASFAVCWYFSDTLYKIAARPIVAIVGPNGMNFMTPTEPFNLLIKIAFITSLFVSAPFIFAQIWLFVSPGLHKHEKKYMLPFVMGSSALFLTGSSFGYFVAFPFAVQFLVGIGKDLGMTPVINAADYFDLFLAIILLLGVVFEIPAIIFILARIGLVSARFLWNNVGYAILLTSIIAAVITPTSDIPNMMIVMIPMMALYMLGIGVAFIFGKKRKKDD